MPAPSSRPRTVRLDPETAPLFKRFWRTRSSSARSKIVAAYVPLVKNIANDLWRKITTGPLVERDDLVSVGVIGLMGAIERWDPSRGTPFATYAARRVRGSMIDSLRSIDWVPRSVRAAQRIGECEPTVVLSLEHVICDSDCGQDHTGLDVLADLSAPDPADVASSNDWWATVTADLTPRERRLVMLYHRRGLTMRQVGSRLGLSESRISQIHAEALPRVRKAIERMNFTGESQ